MLGINGRTRDGSAGGRHPVGGEPVETVMELGTEIRERLWPSAVEVRVPGELAPLPYPEIDFRRLMEILLSRALAAPGQDGVRRASVASRDDGRYTLYSVHSPDRSAFNNGGEDNPLYPIAGAKSIVHAHGGVLWVDHSGGEGATAIFTVPDRRGRGRHSRHLS